MGQQPAVAVDPDAGLLVILAADEFIILLIFYYCYYYNPTTLQWDKELFIYNRSVIISLLLVILFS